MKLSFVSLAFSLLAAGSQAKPCPNAKQVQLNNKPNMGNTASNGAEVIDKSVAPGSNSRIIPAGQVQCPGFKNVVFNTGAANNPGFPHQTWKTLVEGGVSNWIGFSLFSLDMKSSYNNVRTTPELNEAQIHMVMDEDDIQDGLEMLQSDSPPKYLALLNEPDFSYRGYTKTIDPVPAGQKLAKFFTTKPPGTKYLSPAVAVFDGPWLKTFHSAYPQYFRQIDIISIHVYFKDAKDVIDLVKRAHVEYPDHTIWITELSPAEPSCAMDTEGLKKWMHDVTDGLRALTYVEKIFWNCGEQSPPSMTGGTICNPSLTKEDGSPTELGVEYGKICGGSSGVETA